MEGRIEVHLPSEEIRLGSASCDGVRDRELSSTGRWNSTDGRRYSTCRGGGMIMERRVRQEGGRDLRRCPGGL